MTMTAYDIIAQLKMAPEDYHRALVFNPRHIGEAKFVSLRVEPLRFMQKTDTFRIPAEGAYKLAAELDAIFAAARKLTA